ncbi:MAG: DUF3488 and DUF4129 domain-containing transglutaminase family protein [Woeseia sp.]|nr:DUF3488 and DUF4129 domain-containing transglutaminase family protein [Woeseia sp.]
MKKRSGTDGSLLPSLPWTLGALAFALLPHMPFLPFWITGAWLACAGSRWLIERRRWRLPPAGLRVALALGSFIGVFASYDTISGVGPGSALLAIMAALKLLETKRRRDQFVLLFIAIFLIMSSLLREQYLWSLPYLMVGIVVTMTAWLQMAASTSQRITDSLKTSGRLIAYSLPLMLAMWVLFPRIATPFWAVPIDSSSATSGLSDTMNPGDISSLSMSDEVAFRVQFDGAVPRPSQRYWRGLVLYRFNGRSWTGLEPSPDWRARDRIEPIGDPVSYTVTLEPTRQHWILALDIPFSWTSKDVFMGPQQQLTRTKPIDQRLIYKGVSYPEFFVDRDAGRLPLDWYRRLPMRSNPRARDLALELRQAAASEQQFVNAVLQRFNQQEYFYTLQPPQLGANPVDEFLFETRRGFCEHYASAFAVMMRAADIPARIVLGYQGGELNPLGNYLIVRQSDAHAWTEVWLEGRGWVRVDPTAAVAPERIEAGMSGAMADGSGLSASMRLLHNLGLTWDAVNAKWNDWVLGYGPDKQNEFMNWLGMQEPDWRKLLLTLVAVVLLLIVAVSALLMWRYRPPHRDAATKLYQRYARRIGSEPQPAETPLQFATRIRDQQPAAADGAAKITQLYLHARYGGGGEPAVEELRQAVNRYAGSAQVR